MSLHIFVVDAVLVLSFVVLALCAVCVVDGLRVLRLGYLGDFSVLDFTVSCSSGSSPKVRGKACGSAGAVWLTAIPGRSAAATVDSS